MLDNLAREMLGATERPHLKLVGSSVRPKIWEQIPIDFGSGGVTVHLDTEGETHYIDTTPDHDPKALVVLLGMLPTYGFEPMPEWEYPAETLDNGTTRVWLAEVVG
jgi:hypothetical protein